MAQFYVGNVNFESTANNQLVYSANTVTVRVGGINAMVINSTGVAPNASLTWPSNWSSVYTSGLVSTVNNSFVVSGAVIVEGSVTPTVIAANTADWAPGIGNTYNIRVSANSNVANSEYMITGMTAGTNGQIVTLHNIGGMGIWIRNEESGSNGAILPGINTPSSTAANRFNLPNHFKLEGYQSAQFYYDGTLARWRLTDSSSIPVDHKKALTKGFFSGGYTSPASPFGASAVTDRNTYSTETIAAVAGANLSQARFRMGAAGNACKGFFSGGQATPVGVVTADRTTFSTEATAAVPGANLSQARQTEAVGNACKGFISGGCNLLATADKTTYATETTAAVPGANLTQARYGAAAVGNACKGFFSGGANNTTIVATTDRTTYVTEATAAVPGANLTQARFYLTGAGNACKGFIIGGASTSSPSLTPQATACRTTFATETTAAVTGANFTAGKYDHGAAGSACKGFFSGSGAPFVNTTQRTAYTTETTAAAPGSTLSQGRGGLVAI